MKYKFSKLDLELLKEALGEVEEYSTIAKPPIKNRVKRVARLFRCKLEEIQGGM